MKRRAWASVLVVLTGLALGGCSGDDEKSGTEGEEQLTLTYLGDEVLDVEGTLKAADAVWKQTHTGWGQVITVPEESRCYFLVKDENAIDNAFCGPFRGLGTSRPEWVRLLLVPQSQGPGAVELSPGQVVPYERDPQVQSQTLVRADGTEGDWDLDVAEPTGWPKKLKPGQTGTQPIKQFQRRPIISTKVRMLGYDYTVRLVTSQRAQFHDRSIYVPRKGGTFVDFRFRAYDSEVAGEAMAALHSSTLASFGGPRQGRIKLLVTSGGRTWRGSYASPHPGRGIYLGPTTPSGFFSVPDAEDATYAIVVDGKRVEITR